MSLRKVVESLPRGRAALASARLRRRVLRALDEGLVISGLNQADLARRLGKSRSAVNQVLSGDGNLRVGTLAEYLEAMGCELTVAVRPTGQAGANSPLFVRVADSWTAVEFKSTGVRARTVIDAASLRAARQVPTVETLGREVGAA